MLAGDDLRLAACYYAMAYPESGALGRPCLQHCVLGQAESRTLLQVPPRYPDAAGRRHDREPECRTHG